MIIEQVFSGLLIVNLVCSFMLGIREDTSFIVVFMAMCILELFFALLILGVTLLVTGLVGESIL